MQLQGSSNGRYVGGLVSTVDLLEYGFAGPSFDSKGIAAIRRQAEILTQVITRVSTFPTILTAVWIRRRECGFHEWTFGPLEELVKIYGVIHLFLPPAREAISLNMED